MRLFSGLAFCLPLHARAPQNLEGARPFSHEVGGSENGYVGHDLPGYEVETGSTGDGHVTIGQGCSK